MSIRLLIGLAAVLLAPAAAVAETAGTGAPRPVIEVPQTSQDGGTLEEGAVAQFRFTVFNRGLADLEISQVKPSCGCTVAQWDRVIKSGAQGTIKAQMNTQYTRGTITKQLTIFSNDSAQPQVELAITVHTIPLVNISPGLNARLVVEDKPVTQEFTLERNGGQPMKIMQVIPNSQFVNAAATPLPGSGRYQLTITALPDAPLGCTMVPVQVWTDVPHDEALTFDIMVERGIVAIPPLVFYGILPKATKAPQQVAVTILRDTASFHVKSLAVNDPHLTPKLETVRDGAEYRVTITYAGGWDPGVRRQMLTVATDDPQQPVIEIPVEAIIQANIAKGLPVVNH
jgi:hypothetical protein